MLACSSSACEHLHSRSTPPAQASQALALQQLSCMGRPAWGVSALASRRLSGAEATAGSSAAQVLPQMELPASASSFAYYRLHPPEVPSSAAQSTEGAWRPHACTLLSFRACMNSTECWLALCSGTSRVGARAGGGARALPC
jgi:hypothetical protein